MMMSTDYENTGFVTPLLAHISQVQINVLLDDLQSLFFPETEKLCFAPILHKPRYKFMYVYIDFLER